MRQFIPRSSVSTCTNKGLYVNLPNIWRILKGHPNVIPNAELNVKAQALNLQSHVYQSRYLKK